MFWENMVRVICLQLPWARGSDGEYLYHYGEIEGQGRHGSWIAVAERYSGAMEASPTIKLDELCSTVPSRLPRTMI